MDLAAFKATLKGNSFYGAANVSPNAGYYGSAQLYNPPGSGVILIVQSAIIQAQSGTSLAMGFADSVLTRAGQNSNSKYYRTGAAEGKIYVDTLGDSNAAYHNFTQYLSFFANGSSGAPIDLIFNDPIILPAGAGLNLTALTTGIPSFYTFDWIEEPG